MQDRNQNNQIHDYVRAVFSGAYAGVLDLLRMAAHPVDEVFYPISMLVYDSTIILARYQYPIINHPFAASFDILQRVIARNPALYTDAVARMQARGNALKGLANGFANASGPKRVEMLSQVATSVLTPGWIVKGAKVASNINLLARINPPRFIDTYQHAPTLPHIPHYSKTTIKNAAMSEKFLYVITDARKLLLTPQYQNVAEAGSGFRYISEVHHQELGRLKEVLAAGETDFINGNVAKINNNAGRYKPHGPHLKKLIENSFMRDGFPEARGKFFDSHIGFSPNPQPNRIGMLPSLPTTLSASALQIIRGADKKNQQQTAQHNFTKRYIHDRSLNSFAPSLNIMSTLREINTTKISPFMVTSFAPVNNPRLSPSVNLFLNPNHYGQEWRVKDIVKNAIKNEMNSAFPNATLAYSIAYAALGGYGYVLSLSEFRSVAASTDLIDSYNAFHPFAKLKDVEKFCRDIGGVASQVATITDLIDSKAHAEAEEYILCFPEESFPNSSALVKQVARELARAFEKGASPFYSQQFNNKHVLYPLIHPAYQNTLIGEIIGFLDYWMKGFLNGGAFDREFLKVWHKAQNCDENYLRGQMIDLKKYCQKYAKEVNYRSLPELESRYGLANKSDAIPSAYGQPFMVSFRIISYQEKIERYDNILIPYPTVRFEYTIDPRPDYKNHIEDYRKKHGEYPPEYHKAHYLYQQYSEEMKEKLLQIPFLQEFFRLLGVSNAFGYMNETLDQMGKMPYFETPEIKATSAFPKALPPYPVRYYRTYPMVMTFEQVIRDLLITEKETQAINTIVFKLFSEKRIRTLPENLAQKIQKTILKLVKEKLAALILVNELEDINEEEIDTIFQESGHFLLQQIYQTHTAIHYFLNELAMRLGDEKGKQIKDLNLPDKIAQLQEELNRQFGATKVHWHASPNEAKIEIFNKVPADLHDAIRENFRKIEDEHQKNCAAEIQKAQAEITKLEGIKQNLENDINQALQSIAALEQNKATQLNTIEESMRVRAQTQINECVSVVDQAVNNINAEINEARKNIELINQGIANIHAAISAVSNEISTMEATINANYTAEVQNAQAEITRLQGIKQNSENAINQGLQSIAALEQSKTAQINAIPAPARVHMQAQINQFVTAINQRINEINVGITETRKDIELINQAIAATQAAIAAAPHKVSAMKANINAQCSAETQQNQAKLAKLQGIKQDLENSINQEIQSIAALEQNKIAQVNAIPERVRALNQPQIDEFVTAVDQDINNLNVGINKTRKNIELLNQNIANIQAAIAAASAKAAQVIVENYKEEAIRILTLQHNEDTQKLATLKTRIAHFTPTLLDIPEVAAYTVSTQYSHSCIEFPGKIVDGKHITTKINGGCAVELPNIKSEPILNAESFSQALAKAVPEKAEEIGKFEFNGQAYVAFRLPVVDVADQLQQKQDREPTLQDQAFSILDDLAEQDIPLDTLAENLKQIKIDESGATFLHYGAAALSEAPFAKLLPVLSNQLNVPDQFGHLPIHTACQTGNVAVVTQLIALDSSQRDAKNHRDVTPLQLAVQYGQEAVVAKLLELDADANFCMPNGLSPLYVAIQNNFPDIALLLLEKVADRNVSARLDDGMTPLHLACERKLIAVAIRLIEKGATLDAKRNTDGYMPLHCAAEQGQIEPIKAMVARGFSPHLALETKKTALHIAAEAGHLELVHYLLAQGLDINAKTADGDTPIMLAIKAGESKVAHALADLAGINIVNNHNETASLLAQQYHMPTVADVFIERKENPLHRDKDGHNYLYYLTCHGDYRRFFNLVENHAIDIHQTFADESLLAIAAKHGHFPLAYELINRKACFTTSDRSETIHYAMIHYAVMADEIEFLDDWLEHHAMHEPQILSGQYREKFLASLAAQEGSERCLNRLLQTLSVAEREPSRLLLTAILYRKASTAEVVLKYVKNINEEIAFFKGDTALHQAVRAGSCEIVDLLMKRGADAQLRNLSGQTPFHIALTQEDACLLKRLFKLTKLSEWPNDLWQPTNKKLPSEISTVLKKYQKRSPQGLSSSAMNSSPTTTAAPASTTTNTYTVAELGSSGLPQLVDQKEEKPTPPAPLNLPAEALNGLTTEDIKEFELCLKAEAFDDAADLLEQKPILLRAFKSPIGGKLFQAIIKNIHDYSPEINKLLFPSIDRLLKILKDAEVNPSRFTGKNNALFAIIQSKSDREANYRLDLLCQHFPECLPILAQDHYSPGLRIMRLALNSNKPMLFNKLKTWYAKNPTDNHPFYALHEAVMANKSDMVNDLLKDYSTNLQNDRKKTPLMLAAAQGNLRIMELLLQHDASVHQTDIYGRNALYYAILSKSVPAALRLLPLLHKPNQPDRNGKTPLSLAAMHGMLPVVRFLCEDTNYTQDVDAIGRNALHYAAIHGQVKVIDYLISHGFQVDAPEAPKKPSKIKQCVKRTALHLAARFGHIEAVCKLLSLGADPNLKDTLGNAFCEYALLSKDSEMLDVVQQFIAYHEKDHHARLLHAATTANNALAVNALIAKHTIDINAVDKNGRTALHLAAVNNAGAVADILVQSEDVIPDLTDTWGDTALHDAAKYGHVRMIEILMRAGATIDKKNHDQKTPLLIACEEGHLGAVVALLKYEADVTICDANGREPEQVALHNGHTDIAARLNQVDKKSNASITKELVQNYIPQSTEEKIKSSNEQLLAAAKAGDYKKIQAALDDRAEIAYADQNGFTALHFAVDKATVTYLLDRGANTLSKTVSQMIPLHSAASFGNVDTIQVLFSRNPQTLDEKDHAGFTPLHYAIYFNQAKAVEALLKLGANTQIKTNAHTTRADHNCLTPLEMAQVKNRIEIIDILKATEEKIKSSNDQLLLAAKAGNCQKIQDALDDGADIAYADQNGFTALHFAVDKATVTYLLDRGANTLSKTVSQMIPLHSAVLFGNVDTIQALFSRNPQTLDEKDHVGFTPLHYAVYYNQSNAVERFLALGANSQVKTLAHSLADHNCLTPLEMAQVKQHANIISILQNHHVKDNPPIIHDEQFSLLKKELDYFGYQSKSLDFLKKCNEPLFIQWQRFCQQLDLLSINKSQKFMLLQTAFRCLNQPVSQGELEQLIKAAVNLQSTHGTKLFLLLFNSAVLTEKQRICDYIMVCQLLVELHGTPQLFTLAQETLPDFKSLLKQLRVMQDKYLYTKYPERNIDAVIERFGRKDTLVQFPLSATELNQLRAECLLIKEQIRKIKTLPLSVIKERATKCGLDLRKNGNKAAKYKLIALIAKTIRHIYKISPYDTQIISLLALINTPEKLKGRIAQIKTGEGKSTIIAMLDAFMGLQGNFVDVVTSSDYLAIRDAEKYKPFFEALGLSVSHICDKEPQQSHFHGQILYGTNADFEFAMLRDGLSHTELRYSLRDGKLQLRSYDVVITDEADNLFLDTALNSALLSIPSPEDFTWVYPAIFAFIKKSENQRRAASKEMVSELRQTLLMLKDGKFYKQIDELSDKRLKKWMHSAQVALNIKTEGRDYLIKSVREKTAQGFYEESNQIVIVDYAHTGRLNEGCQWKDGIHQFLQAKHNLKITPESLTGASVAHPTYFSLYRHIMGLTGTVGEAIERDEIQRIYGVDSFDVPPHFNSLRTELPPYIAETREQQYKEILNKIKETQQAGRPILVLFKTILESENFSQLLHSEKIHHQLINENQRASEDYLVACAGEQSMCTIATNTAGRGTDILLQEMSKKMGGLAVILAFYPDNLRVKLQGDGRAARQGDLGTCCMILNIHDETIQMLLAWAHATPSKEINVLGREIILLLNLRKMSGKIIPVIFMQPGDQAFIPAELIIPLLDQLRTQHIQEESERRYQCSQQEALYFGKLQLFFEQMNALYQIFEKPDFKEKLLGLCRAETIGDDDSSEMQVILHQEGSCWPQIYEMAKLLLEKQISGITVDWSSFFDQFKNAYLENARLQWAIFYNKLHNDIGYGQVDTIRQQVEEVYTDAQTQLNQYLSNPSENITIIFMGILNLAYREMSDQFLDDTLFFKPESQMVSEEVNLEPTSLAKLLALHQDNISQKIYAPTFFAGLSVHLWRQLPTKDQRSLASTSRSATQFFVALRELPEKEIVPNESLDNKIVPVQ